MLCLKAVALDDQECLPQNQSSPNNSNNGAGFVLPINLGSSVHRYLWKKGWSFSSGDGSLSPSDFEDSIRQCRTRRTEKCLYRCQLEEDIKELEQQLQQEIELRLSLESAVEHSDSTCSTSTCQLPHKAQDLLDSIVLLETTVSKLEQETVALQYQLSQERNERRLTEYRLRHWSSCPLPSFLGFAIAHLKRPIIRPPNQDDAARKIDENSTLPDSIQKQSEDYFSEHLWHHPCHLSKEMVRCMRDIFLFLSNSSKLSASECMDSPSSPQGHLSYASMASFSDSPVISSLPRSPSVDLDRYSEVSSRDGMFDPYRFPGKVEWSRSIGNYCKAVDVSWFSVGKKELQYAAMALKQFRLLLEHLGRVDPVSLTCNEKLAFWINIYNALIMHAYLAYGVPTSDMKFYSLIQKAAYTVGGLSLTAADIEFVILRMKPPAHRPQMALIHALHKFKVSEDLKKYAIDHPEPLLSFAMSCGMHSSPAVRIFTPDNVKELLEESLRDYVQASVGISSKGKLLVPKLLHCFAKGVVEDSLLPEWICRFLSSEQTAMVRDCSTNHKWRLLGARGFSILSYDTRFRFLFLMDDIDPR